MRTALAIFALLACAFLARDLVAAVGAPPSPTVTFHGDGTLKTSIVYVNGLPSGPAEEFYADGRPAWRGSFSAGLREGAWTFWSRAGEVDPERSGTYRAGRKVE